MGTSASKPPPQPEENRQEPVEDEGKRLMFYVLGNYADFSTTAVIRRYVEPKCAVDIIDFTPAGTKTLELGGTKYKVVMLSLCFRDATQKTTTFFFHVMLDCHRNEL